MWATDGCDITSTTGVCMQNCSLHKLVLSCYEGGTHHYSYSRDIPGMTFTMSYTVWPDCPYLSEC